MRDQRSTLRIREARVDDSPALARIQVDSYRSAYAGIFPQDYLDRFTVEEQAQDWRDLLASESPDVLCVAEADSGEIVGYTLGRPGPTGFPGYDAELVALHVRQAYQRQGYGRALLAAVAVSLRSAGSRSLMLWVLEANPARSFYEHLGARPLGATQEMLGAVEVAYGWQRVAALAAMTGVLEHEGAKGREEHEVRKA